jgi:hypothetical protein
MGEVLAGESGRQGGRENGGKDREGARAGVTLGYLLVVGWPVLVFALALLIEALARLWLRAMS